MRRVHESLLAATAALVLGAATATAQSPNVPAPPQRKPLAILNGTVHVVSADPEVPAVIERGWILVRDGVIVGVGGPDAPPAIDESWEVIDAAGRHVCPGFHAMDTQLGLVETMAVRATDDRRELGEVTPEVTASIAINPDTDLIPVSRAGGILLASVAPLGGLMPGWTSVIRLEGWTPQEMTIEPQTGLVLNWPIMETVRAPWMRRDEGEQKSRTREQLRRIEELFDAAAAWRNARAADPETPQDLRLDAISRTLDGGRPLLVSCGSPAQIEAAVAFAARRNLRIVIIGGPGSLECAALLAERGIPVLVDGVHRLPRRRHDRPAEPFELPGRLHAAGVKVAIGAAEEPGHERNLPHQAGTAVAHGMPPHAALAAITRVPAEIAGIADRYGSIEVGRSATLLVLDGPPLEVTTAPVLAFIDGRAIDLSSRQSRQLDKYLEKYRRLGRIEEAAPAPTSGAAPRR